MLVFATQFLYGQELNFDVEGTWNYTIPANDILEAGHDFSGDYASSPSQIMVSVYLSGGWIGIWWNYFINYTWQVEVTKNDIDWDPNIGVYIRRTGNGSGIGGGNYISGGNTYMEVTNANQLFFEGGRARLDVPVQLEVRGISVTLPAKNYSTTIVYTVTSTF